MEAYRFESIVSLNGASAFAMALKSTKLRHSTSGDQPLPEQLHEAYVGLVDALSAFDELAAGPKMHKSTAFGDSSGF